MFEMPVPQEIPPNINNIPALFKKPLPPEL
jgi:hypothetical protein